MIEEIEKSMYHLNAILSVCFMLSPQWHNLIGVYDNFNFNLKKISLSVYRVIVNVNCFS